MMFSHVLHRTSPLVVSLFSSLLFLISAALYVPSEAQAKNTKAEDIMLMLKLSGQQALSEQMITLMVPQLINVMSASNPDLPKDKLTLAMSYMEKALKKSIPEFLRSLIPIYDQNFTHEEIKGLITFYKSPVGRALIEKQPKITAEASKVGQAWGARVAQNAMKGALELIK
jgi:hypothetical protein